MSAHTKESNQEKAYDSIGWTMEVTEPKTVTKYSIEVDDEKYSLSENAFRKLQKAEIEHYLDAQEDERKRLEKIIKKISCSNDIGEYVYVSDLMDYLNEPEEPGDE
jgi:hypothetical protein